MYLHQLYEKSVAYHVPNEFNFLLPEFLIRFMCHLILFLWPVYVHDTLKKRFKKNSKILFVVNHNIWSLDIYALYAVIYLHTGCFPLGLADRLWFKIPILTQFFYSIGIVPGDRKICDQLMKKNVPLLVFPGGSNEVFRPKGYEKYTLEWNQRSGFASLAIDNNYTIIPVASIGLDDMFTILWDFPLGFFLKYLGDKRTSMTFPILFPISFQKLYFYIGNEIDTNVINTPENVWMIREKTRFMIEQHIQDLLALRSHQWKNKKE